MNVQSIQSNVAPPPSLQPEPTSYLQVALDTIMVLGGVVSLYSNPLYSAPGFTLGFLFAENLRKRKEIPWALQAIPTTYSATIFGAFVVSVVEKNNFVNFYTAQLPFPVFVVSLHSGEIIRNAFFK